MKIAKIYDLISLAVAAMAAALYFTDSLTNEVILVFGFVALAVGWGCPLVVFPQQMSHEVGIGRNH